MKKLFSACILLLWGSFLSAQKAPPMPKFEEAVSFYISFDDGTPNADITDGEDKPVNILGKKECVFLPGIRGKALLCGENGSKLWFLRKENLNLEKPGTLVFFYKGMFKSRSSGPRVFFWGIESSKGYIGQHLSNDPKTVCPCRRELHTMFYYGKRIKNRILYTKLAGGEEGCEKWHMLAFSWAPGRLAVKFDDTPEKNYAIPFDMKESDFPAVQFSIGSHLHWEYCIDEFTIYNRKLSDAELTEIYKLYFGK